MTSSVIAFPRPAKVPSAWTFADRVRKVRRELKLTQADFAALIGVGDKAYAAWESGANEPRDLVHAAETLEARTGYDRRWWLGWLDAEIPHPDGPDEGNSGTVRRQGLEHEPAG